MNVTWILIGIIIGLFFVLGYVVFGVIRNENRRRKWISTTEVGDVCNISSPENRLKNVKIVNISDKNIVTVELKVSKRWVYPPNKK
jgi:hypothetical protein